MNINLGLNGIESSNYYKEWDGLRYQAQMKSPKKMGTQNTLNEIINKSEEVKIEFKDVDSKVEIYLNEEYISHVLDSKYKAVALAVKNMDHTELIIEQQKNGDYKVIPCIFYNLPE